jgi:hypothetical protein
MPSPDEPPAPLGLHDFPFYAATPGAILDVTVGVLGDHRGVEVVDILTVLPSACWQANMAR